jgi:hypothetical protein
MRIGTECADGDYWACLRCPFWCAAWDCCSSTIVTLIGWLVELAVVGTTDERQGIVGLGVGLLTGMLVALLTWLPGRRVDDNDISDTYGIE